MGSPNSAQVPGSGQDTPVNKAPEDFKARLLREKQELDEKREKLEAFQNSEAFQKIDIHQQSLLNLQAGAMLTYSQCLTERIALL